MGLICPKCHTDNLLNAIFCRGCGEKLDLNAMKPEDLIADEVKKKPGSSLGAKIFLGVVAALVLLILVGIVIPAGGKSSPAELAAELKTQFKEARKASVKDKTFSFSNQQATDIVNSEVKDQFPQNGNMVPQQISIAFLDDNVIKVILSCKAFGFLPVDNVLKIKYTVDEKGGVSGEYLGASYGLIPLFGGLEDNVVQLIQPLFDGWKNYEKLKKATKKSSCSAGTISIEH